MKLFLKHACDPICIFRSFKVALVIGTLHGIINHFDEVIDGTLTTTNIIQILITYLIPYSVATYGSAMQARYMELAGGKKAGSEKQGEGPGDRTDRPPGATSCAWEDDSETGERKTQLTAQERLRLFFRYAQDPVCVGRAIKVALVIGTIIVLLNHFDAIMDGTVSRTNILQMLITYTVPFCVSTYGAAMQACHIELTEQGDQGEGTGQDP